MAVVNLNRGGNSGQSTTDRPILPTDMFRMKCVEATLKEDTFAQPLKDGTKPLKISTVWEVQTLTDEQADAAAEAGEEWVGVRIWKDFNPYYGDVRDGGPSKFKAFIDDLRAQGLLPNFDPDAFEVEDLAGIEQKASVQLYTKTMGENAGKPGNKIMAFAPLRPARGAKTTAKPAARNTPQVLPEPEAPSGYLEDVPF